VSQDPSPETNSLGGDDQSGEYHPLALDPDASNLWGWIDQAGERVSGLLNPILIKEARQSLKSRQFIATFFLLLLASCVWTVLGVVANAPDVYYLPSGDSLLTGYYFVLAIPLIGIVPLSAHRSLAAEIDDNTFEMLVITRLSAMRIVTGKLNSAMLQMMVYFAAIVPCLAFSYLLRGVDLPTIALLIGIVFFTALLLTTFCLMFATLAFNRASQTLALLAVLSALVFAEFLCGAFCMEVVLGRGMGSQSEMIIFTAVFFSVGGSCMVIFVRAAAARIAPVTENRSTPLRRTMYFQQLIWVAVIAFMVLWYEDHDVLNFGIMVIGGYWLVMGTLMLSESSELSPRVQRRLPSTYAGRLLLTWFNPGPGTGFVFAISSGVVGAMVLGLFGQMIGGRQARTDSMTFSLIIAGYLMAYLGITRLIVMPLGRRFGQSLILPLATMATVMGIAAVTPLVLSVLTTGSPPYSYQNLEAIDWVWTLFEAFDQGYAPSLAAAVFFFGLMVLFINLTLLFREFRYRRITVPDRVLADQQLHG
jgi:hypothetical protein